MSGPAEPSAGGLRARLVRDSFALMLRQALGDLGWFDHGRDHKAIDFRSEPLEHDEPVEPNLIAVSVQAVERVPLELGSAFASSRMNFAVDMLVEGESLGEHLWGDIHDILRGRMIRTRPTFTIFDLRQIAPTSIGYGVVVDVSIDRMWSDTETDWKRRWFRAGVIIDDSYYGESNEFEAQP